MGIFSDLGSLALKIFDSLEPPKQVEICSNCGGHQKDPNGPAGVWCGACGGSGVQSK